MGTGSAGLIREEEKEEEKRREEKEEEGREWEGSELKCPASLTTPPLERRIFVDVRLPCNFEDSCRYSNPLKGEGRRGKKERGGKTKKN